MQRPLLFANEGRFAWFIKANVSAVSENYWPTVWCYETHILTTLANFLRGLLPELKYHRYIGKRAKECTVFHIENSHSVHPHHQRVRSNT